MTTSTTRPFIAAMQVTLDGYLHDPEGVVDWVDSWADGLELLPPVDAFVLGGGMFPDYEQFWTAIRDDPDAATAMLGRDLYPRELTYARVAAQTPHLVLSRTLADTNWPSARIVRDIHAIGALKQEPGNPVYVVGGPRFVTSLIEAGLLDELRLIVHPVAVGGGRALFTRFAQRQAFELVAAAPTEGGRVNLSYRVRRNGPTR
jgi:dihydrofolate reductase